jgi:hypothetical protein
MQVVPVFVLYPAPDPGILCRNKKSAKDKKLAAAKAPCCLDRVAEERFCWGVASPNPYSGQMGVLCCLFTLDFAQ